ncbi:MAG: hypothetical protein QXF86_03125 [Candidatus Bilamarchaeaceae archaeon]
MKQEQKKTKTYYNRLENEADEMCKWIVFVLQKGLDIWSGEMLAINFQPHHFIHRKNKSLRWDLSNIFAVNQTTHFLIHSGSEGIFGAELQKKYPDRISYLLEKKNKVSRFRKNEIESIHYDLSKQFYEIFKMSYNDFKKFSLEEKYRIAVSVIRREV